MSALELGSRPQGTEAGSGAVATLIAAQLVLMRRFLADATARAVWYSGFGVPLFVIGMMVSAFALRAA